MTALLIESSSHHMHPLDLVEEIAMERDWPFDRSSDDELIVDITSAWCSYRAWYTWQPEIEGLIFSCALETKLPRQSRDKIYPLLAQVNEKLWLGHFDLSSEDGSIVFRHALPLKGGIIPSPDQINELFDIAISECDRFYPAYQSVIWGNKPTEEALRLAIFETVGEA